MVTDIHFRGSWIMIIGYARVSTVDQNLEAQVEALKAAGCEKIFHDKSSGKDKDRPGLKEALSHLRHGDTFIVCKLDRMSRSLRDLVNQMHDFEYNGIIFHSLQDKIDTSTAAGKLNLALIAAMAEFEQGLAQERTKFALSAARARGKSLGRKAKVGKEDEQLFIDLYLNRNTKIGYIAKKFGMSLPCVYSTAERLGVKDRCAKVQLIEEREAYLKSTAQEKL